ncbi:MAG: tRNA (adenosine(37)-N6)-threonylcarbamoyltransferase complex dimerization subunit type 1 TsaB [Candidatus Omnitrophota bacterium]
MNAQPSNNPPCILALEPSTRTFGLAVGEGRRVLADLAVENDRALSSLILPRVRDVLKQAGKKLEQIDALAVGLGPGSFTSLRVGVSTVKGLAHALDIPVIGIPTLDVIARNAMPAARDETDGICVLGDARRGLVFFAGYTLKDGEPVRATEYLLIEPKAALSSCRGRNVFLGDGAELYRKLICEQAEDAGTYDPVILPLETAAPRTAVLFELAVRRFRQGAFDSIDSLVPLYLYEQDCQVRKDGRRET